MPDNLRITERDDLCAAIGRVTINSAYLEFALREMIESMVNGDGTVCLTTDMTFANLVHVACALGRRIIKTNPALEKYLRIVNDAGAAYSERNKIVHSGWTDSGDRWCVAFRMRARGKLIMQGERWTLEEIESIAMQLNSVSGSVYKLTSSKKFMDRTMFDEASGARRLRVESRKTPLQRAQSRGRKTKSNRQKQQPLP